MWSPLVFFFLAFVGFATALTSGSWDESLGMDVAFVEEGDGFEEVFTEAEREITLTDFLKVPFNPDVDSQDKIIFDSIVSDPSFQAARAAAIQMNYYMDVATYDRLHADTLKSLRSVAASLNIPVELTTSYSTILSEIDSAMSKQDRAGASFAELGTQVGALRSSSYLFEGRHTLFTAVHEDAIALGIKDKLQDAFQWLKQQINNNKCSWCKGIVSYIKNKACQAAGKWVCTTVLSAVGGVVGSIISKFVCGKPINLSNILAKWCEKAVASLQKLTRATDACICSFKAGISIPSVKILGKQVGGFTLGNNQQVCPTNPGECAWHSKDDKQKWDGTEASAGQAASLPTDMIKTGLRRGVDKISDAAGNAVSRAYTNVATRNMMRRAAKMTNSTAKDAYLRRQAERIDTRATRVRSGVSRITNAAGTAVANQAVNAVGSAIVGGVRNGVSLRSVTGSSVKAAARNAVRSMARTAVKAAGYEVADMAGEKAKVGVKKVADATGRVVARAYTRVATSRMMRTAKKMADATGIDYVADQTRRIAARAARIGSGVARIANAAGDALTDQAVGAMKGAVDNGIRNTVRDMKRQGFRNVAKSAVRSMGNTVKTAVVDEATTMAREGMAKGVTKVANATGNAASRAYTRIATRNMARRAARMSGAAKTDYLARQTERINNRATRVNSGVNRLTTAAANSVADQAAGAMRNVGMNGIRNTVKDIRSQGVRNYATRAVRSVVSNTAKAVRVEASSMAKETMAEGVTKVAGAAGNAAARGYTRIATRNMARRAAAMRGAAKTDYLARQTEKINNRATAVNSGVNRLTTAAATSVAGRAGAALDNVAENGVRNSIRSARAAIRRDGLRTVTRQVVRSVASDAAKAVRVEASSMAKEAMAKGVTKVADATGTAASRAYTRIATRNMARRAAAMRGAAKTDYLARQTAKINNRATAVSSGVNRLTTAAGTAVADRAGQALDKVAENGIRTSVRNARAAIRQNGLRRVIRQAARSTVRAAKAGMAPVVGEMAAAGVDRAVGKVAMRGAAAAARAINRQVAKRDNKKAAAARTRSVVRASARRASAATRVRSAAAAVRASARRAAARASSTARRAATRTRAAARRAAVGTAIRRATTRARAAARRVSSRAAVRRAAGKVARQASRTASAAKRAASKVAAASRVKRAAKSTAAKTSARTARRASAAAARKTTVRKASARKAARSAATKMRQAASAAKKTVARARTATRAVRRVVRRVASKVRAVVRKRAVVRRRAVVRKPVVRRRVVRKPVVRRRAARKPVARRRAAPKKAKATVVSVGSDADLKSKIKSGSVRVGAVYKKGGACYKLQSSNGKSAKTSCNSFFYF